MLRHLLTVLCFLALPLGSNGLSEENRDSFGPILEARALARTGRYSEALLILHRSVTVAEQAGKNLTAAIALNNIAEIHRVQGNSPAAINFYEQALEKYRDIGHQTGASMTQQRIDELLLQSEEIEQISSEKRDMMIQEAIERVRNRVLAQKKESEPNSRRGSEYAAYIQGVKNAIVRVWRYPEAALKNRQEGRVEVEFSILENGSLENVRILHTSDIASMDQEALRAVKAAAPFHRIPEKLGLKRMSIEFTFNYILKKSP
jgi:TonB family protein